MFISAIDQTNFFFFFFLMDPATPEIYPLPLPDALPISPIEAGHLPQRHVLARRGALRAAHRQAAVPRREHAGADGQDHQAQPGPAERAAARSSQGNRDRKSTRLNSSHGYISYAVFCLKK